MLVFIIVAWLLSFSLLGNTLPLLNDVDNLHSAAPPVASDESNRDASELSHGYLCGLTLRSDKKTVDVEVNIKESKPDEIYEARDMKFYQAAGLISWVT